MSDPDQWSLRLGDVIVSLSRQTSLTWNLLLGSSHSTFGITSEPAFFVFYLSKRKLTELWFCHRIESHSPELQFNFLFSFFCTNVAVFNNTKLYNQLEISHVLFFWLLKPHRTLLAISAWKDVQSGFPGSKWRHHVDAFRYAVKSQPLFLCNCIISCLYKWVDLCIRCISVMAAKSLKSVFSLGFSIKYTLF